MGYFLLVLFIGILAFADSFNAIEQIMIIRGSIEEPAKPAEGCNDWTKDFSNCYYTYFARPFTSF